MRRHSFEEMNCSIARTLEVVGEWWTLLILREVFNGVRRFEEMRANLGIARNILTTRLQTLVAHDILERRRYQERPERFEYRLTAKGRDLYPILVAFMGWGDRWTASQDAPPVLLEHKRCGHEGTPVLACVHCGEPVGPFDMRLKPGPGAPDPWPWPVAREQTDPAPPTPSPDED